MVKLYVNDDNGEDGWEIDVVSLEGRRHSDSQPAGAAIGREEKMKVGLYTAKFRIKRDDIGFLLASNSRIHIFTQVLY